MSRPCQTDVNFDSTKMDMQKSYFDHHQTHQTYPGSGTGYYPHHASNGYGYSGSDGQLGYNSTPPPPDSYRGNCGIMAPQGHTGVPGTHQGSYNVGPVDYSQHYAPNQCMPTNISPTMGGLPGQGLGHCPDPSMLKGLQGHPGSLGLHHGVGHPHPGSQHPLGAPPGGQEIFPWMKEHRQQTKRPPPPQTTGKVT